MYIQVRKFKIHLHTMKSTDHKCTMRSILTKAYIPITHTLVNQDRHFHHQEIFLKSLPNQFPSLPQITTDSISII